jgi:hypothetical protein
VRVLLQEALRTLDRTFRLNLPWVTDTAASFVIALRLPLVVWTKGQKCDMQFCGFSNV